MTRDELVEYAVNSLGSPLIQIEVTEKQVEYVLQDCFDEILDMVSNDHLLFRELFVAKLGIQWGKNLLKFGGETMPDGLRMDPQGILEFYTHERERIRTILGL